MNKIITGEGEWPNLGEELPEVPPVSLRKRSFILAVKSHCDAPDYEDEVEAEGINEAAKLFWERLGKMGQAEWTPEDLIPYIGVAP